MFLWGQLGRQVIYALSFYVTKTVLVGPKLFWSDQIDLDFAIFDDLVTTKMKRSQPKWIGLVQIVIFYQNESQFGPPWLRLIYYTC